MGIVTNYGKSDGLRVKIPYCGKLDANYCRLSILPNVDYIQDRLLATKGQRQTGHHDSCFLSPGKTHLNKEVHVFLGHNVKLETMGMFPGDLVECNFSPNFVLEIRVEA